ncbi:hypothetical protein [Caballeronia mineralivorans]|uniref:hypothetical protein n=1 Tax=Caballeronia mineralivorans TaxID=2010198 RepID=UPI0023F05341|nr:hypothetical protein [Caballeronia mineralivorans]MDB5789339.1 hypothetical protein [Caballeronia mineralivorans]
MVQPLKTIIRTGGIASEKSVELIRPDIQLIRWLVSWMSMRVDRLRHATGAHPDGLHLLYLGVSLSTEEPSPSILWMYGLPMELEVGFITPAQTIFR